MNKFTLRNKLGDMLEIRRYRYKIYIQLYISIQNGKKNVREAKHFTLSMNIIAHSFAKPA